MKPQHTTVFIIREVATGKLIKFGAKCGWAIGFFDNHTKKDYEVSEEWRQYLIRRHFDDGIED